MSTSKRIPLSERREQDRRGIDAIISETVPAATEEGRELPAAARPRLEKVTLYVRPEQVLAIEEIQVAERRRTGKKPDKSDLVQEALDLLIAKYTSETPSL